MTLRGTFLATAVLSGDLWVGYVWPEACGCQMSCSSHKLLWKLCADTNTELLLWVNSLDHGGQKGVHLGSRIFLDRADIGFLHLLHVSRGWMLLLKLC